MTSTALEHELNIICVDLADPAHCQALVAMLDEYARGPTGSGQSLATDVQQRLPGMLAQRPWYVGWLAFVDDQPAGIVNCFEGLSTFRALPLLNIHDIAVSARYQRRGIARALLQQVTDEALARGCCKITLEVLSANLGAIAAYRQAGFAPFGLDPAMGGALFFEKKFY